jgi:hypothetical protein
MKGTNMRRKIIASLGTMLAIGLTITTAVAPAATQAAGKESFRGALIVGGDASARNILSTYIAADGVFSGHGRIVEVPNRPGDGDNVTRDDLVFPQGKLHLVSTNKSFKVSVNPKTCAVRIAIRQTAKIEGGTGKFSRATGTFAGGVRARGVTFRAANGTCSQQGALLLEVDLVSGHGTISL